MSETTTADDRTADGQPTLKRVMRPGLLLPVVGALACGFLATPWAGRRAEQYRIAGILLAIGVVLWGVTVLVNRRTGGTSPGFDPEALAGDRPSGPRN